VDLETLTKKVSFKVYRYFPPFYWGKRVWLGFNQIVTGVLIWPFRKEGFYSAEVSGDSPFFIEPLGGTTWV